MNESVTVSDYLLSRLQELGVDKLFGVPGDYNLGFLDRVLEHPSVDWVGCANELNASYAADGYARIRGFGALATTFGVGELSAMNGLAGARAEGVAVLEIVGAPSSIAIETSAAVHHTFGDGDFSRFARMSEEITAASSFLSASNATVEIDRVLSVMVSTNLPVQLIIPSDVALARVQPPLAPLDVSAPTPTDEQVSTFENALRRFLGGRKVAIVAGHETMRLQLTDEVRMLVEQAGVPHAVLHRGKGVFNEESENFLGLYAGELSQPQVRAAIDAAEAVVVIGSLFEGGVVPFSSGIDRSLAIEVTGMSTSIAETEFTVPALQALTSISRVLLEAPSPSTDSRSNRRGPAPSRHAAGESLTQASTWDVIGRALEPGQILSAEAGTSYYSLLETRLPNNTTVLAQGMWSSIGYTFPAVLGAQLAAPEKRAVLVIGDGSLQLTAQELGTFVRNGATPIVTIINNSGYTVERAIHGPTAVYNDIALWNWQLFAPALGAAEALTLQASTVGELTAAFQIAYASPERLVLIEAVLPDLDAPALLHEVADAVSSRNGYVE